MVKLRYPLSIFLLVGGLAWIWFSRIPDGSISFRLGEAPQVEFIAPDFSLSALDSQEITLSDLRGNPVILNFWASWCPPCKAEMPAFQQASREFPSDELYIIGINATNQDSLNEVSQFIEQYGITFPVALDHTGSTMQDYLIYSLPTTFFIDKNGTIKEIIIGGPIPLSMLRIQANKLLGK